MSQNLFSSLQNFRKHISKWSPIDFCKHRCPKSCIWWNNFEINWNNFEIQGISCSKLNQMTTNHAGVLYFGYACIGFNKTALVLRLTHLNWQSPWWNKFHLFHIYFMLIGWSRANIFMWDVNYSDKLRQRTLYSTQMTPWWLLDNLFHVFDHFRPPRLKTPLAEPKIENVVQNIVHMTPESIREPRIPEIWLLGSNFWSDSGKSHNRMPRDAPLHPQPTVRYPVTSPFRFWLNSAANTRN